jgi:hypothetical protein
MPRRWRSYPRSRAWFPSVGDDNSREGGISLCRGLSIAWRPGLAVGIVIRFTSQVSSRRLCSFLTTLSACSFLLLKLSGALAFLFHCVRRIWRLFSTKSATSILLFPAPVIYVRYKVASQRMSVQLGQCTVKVNKTAAYNQTRSLNRRANKVHRQPYQARVGIPVVLYTRPRRTPAIHTQGLHRRV